MAGAAGEGGGSLGEWGVTERAGALGPGGGALGVSPRGRRAGRGAAAGGERGCARVTQTGPSSRLDTWYGPGCSVSLGGFWGLNLCPLPSALDPAPLGSTLA